MELSLFAQTLENMLITHEAKNHDYGNSFDITCDTFGIVAALVRMWDKLNRLTSLSKTQDRKVVDEKIEDTLLDLANYAVMTYCWLKQKQNNDVGDTQYDDLLDTKKVVDEAD